jgi:integrase
MKWENFTAELVKKFECQAGKQQSIYWDGKTPGLGLRVTAKAKSYIFQTDLNGKTIRITIGDKRTWSIGDAQAEATRLKAMTDQDIDPRQVKADAIAAKEAKSAALSAKEAIETVTVGEAWKVYISERTASMKDGKPEWGERIKFKHNYFVQAGGEKRKRGFRPGESKLTRPGLLVPLMSMRLADLDAKAVKKWLDTEVTNAPTLTSDAFRYLRAFLNWCAKQEAYSAAAHPDACQSDAVKNTVPKSKVKPNDSLRKAQIKPWFEQIRKINNPIIAAYLQALLLTGARRNELAALKWVDVDFKWKSMTIRDKVEGERTIPLTPYVESLIAPLARRNEFVFSSPTAASGRIEEPRINHVKALAAAALPPLSLHGLRRSFGTLSEWVEVPAGIVAQIMGHKPSAIAEKHYIQRELDLLHLWHVKIEAWILEQAGIEFMPVQAGLRVVKA